MPNLGSCYTWLLKIELFVILFGCVPATVHVHMSVLRINVTRSCDLPGCWKPNTDPLEEQKVL